ncbi:MAG: glycosyltransferase [Clostridia bacterium]|nr:glycosyltransferase [Clostridia bacterium]
MKVLVLTIPTGGGHLSTGVAIEKYMKQRGHEAKLIDVYKYISRLLGGSVQKGYLASTKYAPNMYGKFYRIAEKSDSYDKFHMLKAANSLMTIKFAKYMKAYKPDVVIATHVLAAHLINALDDDILSSVITMGIVTDYTIHPFWDETCLDYYITASELLNCQAAKKNLPLKKVKPFGIPIDQKFADKIEKTEARKIIGIDNKPTVLVMSGSMGFGKVLKHIKELDKLEMDFQMIVVCGNNKTLKRKVDELETVKKVYSFGFVNNVDVLMDASDCIITKPGGLTVSESLAKGMPMILINPIPGQEDRNVEFLLNNGMAQLITSTYPVDEAIYQLFKNEWKIGNLSEGIKYIGKPYATRDLCEFIISLGERE